MFDKVKLIPADLVDGASLVEAIEISEPDEVYHLAAQSFVGASFEQPVGAGEITGLGVTRVLEAIRMVNPRVKFYQASTSELYGRGNSGIQTEETPFQPSSPYAAAKLYGYWLTKIYREAYGFFACNGILFNHESPRRGETFVTRKITRAATRIKLGLQDTLYLGNLDAERDWGYAGNFVEAMWLMLQQDEPEDYVIATGETHSVHEFLDEAFTCLDLDWRDYVKTDPRYLRPSEVDVLLGDASKAREKLGWQPKVRFKELVRMMVEADLALAEREHLVAASSAAKSNRARSR